MALNSTIANQAHPEPVAIGERPPDRTQRDIERVQSDSAPRQRLVVTAVDQLERSFEGDEAVMQDSNGSSMMKFLNGNWVGFHSSLNGMKISKNDSGVPELKFTIDGKHYRLPFVLED